MKILKKFTAITTAAVLLTAGNISILPAGAVNDFVVSASASDEDVVASGNCGAEGANLIWTLDIEGTLTINGEGAMADWEKLSDVPWYSYEKNIVNVIIEDGVTNIGSSAFSYCRSLTLITIPDSVTSIGSSAFSYCLNLTSIKIPDSVTNIGGSAFYFCESLTAITILTAL